MPANLHTLSSLGSIPDAAPTVLTDLREFLAFKIGNEEYGVDILRVQEIRSYEKPTTIANAAADLKGVVNLRGVIVPIIDLRLKLGLPEARYDHLTVVIVLNIGQRVVGVVVDGVSDVLTLEREQLRPVPALDMDVDRDHLLAIGSVDDRMLILLDIEKLLAPSLVQPLRGHRPNPKGRHRVRSPPVATGSHGAQRHTIISPVAPCAAGQDTQRPEGHLGGRCGEKETDRHRPVGTGKNCCHHHRKD